MSEKSVQLAYKIRRHALEMTNRGGTSHIGLERLSIHASGASIR